MYIHSKLGKIAVVLFQFVCFPCKSLKFQHIYTIDILEFSLKSYVARGGF